jgi:hypothetical protein
MVLTKAHFCNPLDQSIDGQRAKHGWSIGSHDGGWSIGSHDGKAAKMVRSNYVKMAEEYKTSAIFTSDTK